MTRPTKGRPVSAPSRIPSHYRWSQALVDGLAALEQRDCVTVSLEEVLRGEINQAVADELILRGCAFMRAPYVHLSQLGLATLSHLRSCGWVTSHE